MVSKIVLIWSNLMIPAHGSIQAKLARQRRIKRAFAKLKQIFFEQGIGQVTRPSEANPQR